MAEPETTRIWRIFTWPALRSWADCGWYFALFLLVSVPFALISGLVSFTPSADGLWQVALIALVMPALGEELVFRAPILLVRRRIRVATLLLVLFVLWHPVNGMFLMTEARALFTDPRFLTVAFGLGMTCTFVVMRAGSIWPAVVIHWLTVVGWKGMFGGPQFLNG